MFVVLSALAISASMQVPIATNTTTDQMTLVFRQQCDSCQNSLKEYGPNDFKLCRNEVLGPSYTPGSDEYSILPQLENMKYRNPDGTEVYKFRLEYHNMGHNSHWFEWTQTNNPMTSASPGTVTNVKIYNGFDNLASKFRDFQGLSQDGVTALLKGKGKDGPDFEIGSFRNLPNNCSQCVVYPHQDQAQSRTCKGLSLYAITNQAKQLEQKIQETTQSLQTMRDFVEGQYRNELKQLRQQQGESDERVNAYTSRIEKYKKEQERYIQTRIDDEITDDQITEALAKSSSNSLPVALSRNFRNVVSEIDVTTFRAQMNGIFESTHAEAKRELAKFLLNYSRENTPWKILNDQLAHEETMLVIELQNKEKIDAFFSSYQSKMNAFLNQF